MKKLAQIIFFSVLCYSSFSQTPLRKGSIVLNNNEKAEGFISLKSENKNPDKITFSREQSFKQATTYQVSDLKSFDIVDVDRYVRATVLTDQRPFNNSLQVPAKLDSFRTETVWLRELNAGQYVSLYELSDSRVHYFISDANGEFKELIYKIGKENDRSYQLKSYILQLQQYLEKSNPESTASFMATKYTQADLVKAVSMINGNIATKNATLKRDLRIHYSVFAGGGVGTSTAKLNGNLFYIGEFDFKHKIFPFGFVGADFYPGRKPGRVAMRVDVSYNSINYQATGDHNVYGKLKYELVQTNITPSVAVLINLINRNYLKFYIGPALSYHLSRYKGNDYVYYYPTESHLPDFLALGKNWASFDIRAGAKINKSWEIALKGEVVGSFQRYNEYNFKTRQYSVALAYHFLRN